MSSRELVTPFVSSLQNVLTTMTGIETVVCSNGREARSFEAHVAGIIGIASNKIRGSLIVSFSKPCFLAVATQMLGDQIVEVDDDVADIAGEIVNMTMGGAKILLAERGLQFELSLPSTAWDERVAVRHAADLVSVAVGLETAHGPLSVELCVAEE